MNRLNKNHDKGNGFLRISARNHTKSHANALKSSCNPLHRQHFATPLGGYRLPPSRRYRSKVWAKSARWPSLSIFTWWMPRVLIIFTATQWLWARA